MSATKINISMLILRKKRTFFAKMEDGKKTYVYNLVLSEDSWKAQTMFQVRQAYATLYYLQGQPIFHF